MENYTQSLNFRGHNNIRNAQRRQLERELVCLERQLERLRRFTGEVDTRTYDTYTEMISSRQQRLAVMENELQSHMGYSVAKV